MANTSSIKAVGLQDEKENLSKIKKSLVERIKNELQECSVPVNMMSRHPYIGPSTRVFARIWSKYRKLWKKTEKHSKNISDENRIMLKSIDDEKFVIIQKNTRFVIKLSKYYKVHWQHCSYTQNHIKLLEQILKKVQLSQNLEELENINIPTFDGSRIQEMGELAVALTDEWKDMQLVSRLAYLYEQLRLLVYPGREIHIDVHND